MLPVGNFQISDDRVTVIREWVSLWFGDHSVYLVGFTVAHRSVGLQKSLVLFSSTAVFIVGMNDSLV